MSETALYVHWPFCQSKCPYCDFNSHVREQVDQARWRDALLQELRWMAERSDATRLTSIFFGGGTPSLMPPATAEAVIAFAKARWNTPDDLEVTLEANPTSVEARRFEALRDAGVNRLSLGVQSLREKDLAFLGRTHDVGQAKAAIALAARLFPRYSFDLIYARPGQTVQNWKAELSEAVALAGGHLSVYQLTIEEGTQFFHRHEAGAFCLPEEEEAEDMYFLTQELLEAAGLPAYETSNHARPGEECRHNLAYWRYRPYLGIGPGAHGRARLAGALHATETLRSPEAWLARVEEQGHGLARSDPLPPPVRREEMLMMGIRLREGLPLAAWSEGSGIPAEALLVPEGYARLISLGLLEPEKDRLLPTPKGRFLLNAIVKEFM